MSVFTVDPERVELELEIKRAKLYRSVWGLVANSGQADADTLKKFNAAQTAYRLLFDEWFYLKFQPLTCVYVKSDHYSSSDFSVVLKDLDDHVEIFSLRSKKISKVSRDLILKKVRDSVDHEDHEEGLREYLSNKTRARVEEVLRETENPLAGCFAMRGDIALLADGIQDDVGLVFATNEERNKRQRGIRLTENGDNFAPENLRNLPFKPITRIFSCCPDSGDVYYGNLIVLSDAGEGIEVLELSTKNIFVIPRESVIPAIDDEEDDEREFIAYLNNKSRIRIEDALEEIGHPLAGQIALRSVL